MGTEAHTETDNETQTDSETDWDTDRVIWRHRQWDRLRQTGWYGDTDRQWDRLRHIQGDMETQTGSETDWDTDRVIWRHRQAVRHRQTVRDGQWETDRLGEKEWQRETDICQWDRMNEWMNEWINFILRGLFAYSPRPRGKLLFTKDTMSYSMLSTCTFIQTMLKWPPVNRETSP